MGIILGPGGEAPARWGGGGPPMPWGAWGRCERGRGFVGEPCMEAVMGVVTVVRVGLERRGRGGEGLCWC